MTADTPSAPRPDARRGVSPATTGPAHATSRDAADLRVRSKVWIERDGGVVISEYRARLLVAVDERGSVAAAAETLGLPYRTAWKKLREMEEAAGVPLLESGSGGATGGASRLTPAARELLAAFARVSEPVGSAVAERFRRERRHFEGHPGS